MLPEAARGRRMSFPRTRLVLLASTALTSELLPRVGGASCDWALEPWKGFEAVTASLEGVPTRWRLSGGREVVRTFSHDCRDQTLILTRPRVTTVVDKHYDCHGEAPCDTVRKVPWSVSPRPFSLPSDKK